MTRSRAEVIAAVNRTLLKTALQCDPIVERSIQQKAIRVGKMRAELIDLGYSIVTTEWLHEVLAQLPKVRAPQ